MRNSIVLPALMGLFFSCCKQTEAPVDLESDNFADSPTSHVVQPADELNEASGLADSHKQPGFLWSHEDAASPNEIFLLNRNGTIVGKMNTPFINFDWEDIAIGPGPKAGETYLYLADIGDNAINLDIKRIYRFPEPASLSSPITGYETIQFRYPDGSYDAETLLLDPLTRDLYVVTKLEGKSNLYRLAYPQSTNGVITAEKIGTMTVGNYLTGGSISTTGKEIIVRGYAAIHYWKRTVDEKIGDVLLRAPAKNLPYIFEPQGEAVCFDKDGKGYFTLSERRNVPSVNLYFYARK